MESAKTKSRITRTQTSPERLLESYYGKFLVWASALARGDAGIAHDIVHDLCLHLTVAKPDLSQVENLDGYLYTCLRHVYISMMNRASREATHLVSIAEYDSIYFALRTGSPEALLQRQNDLRRICNYEIWRKDSSKSASYLTLLFFHGYARREIGEIARVPLAAIYNKLKIARAELKSHLEDSSHVSIASRDVPPPPELLLSVVPFAELFDELRAKILVATASDCLPEASLIADYESHDRKPVSCALLSHIVSCERCLTTLDRHFGRPTLQDREPPVNSGDFMDGSSRRDSSVQGGEYGALMRSMRWHQEKTYEHRPRTLSIAVNGQITAFHDVHGERSTLCSRIEQPDNAQFVEVFTEQNVRLALLPVGLRPPEGFHAQTQRVALSDERWLQLTLSFDGLGLNSEVTYVDPALAIAASDEELEGSSLSGLVDDVRPTTALPAEVSTSLLEEIRRVVRSLMRPRILAWSSLFAVVLIIGLTFVRVKLSSTPSELLSQSMKAEVREANGQVEHQVLRIEETAPDSKVLLQGTIDVWKEGNGRRSMRRLYDSNHRLIAAEWQSTAGSPGSFLTPDVQSLPTAEREFAVGGLWRQEVSPSAFKSIATQKLTMRHLGDNYEITSAASNQQLHLISATLVLDGHLHAVGETLRIQRGSSQSVFRFVEADFERRPASTVPDSIFDAKDLDEHSRREQVLSGPTESKEQSKFFDSNSRLIELHIAVLAQLNKLGADVGEPIEVKRTQDGHIRVSGAVMDAAHSKTIAAALGSMPDHERIEMRIVPQKNVNRTPGVSHRHTFQPLHVYNIDNAQAPAEVLVREYFVNKGWSIDRVNSSAAEFSRDTIGHAQRALQEAFALDRLGSDFSASELRAISFTSRHQWAEMAASHALALNRELGLLQAQISLLLPSAAPGSDADSVETSIQSPEQFARIVHQIFGRVQHLNERIGVAFASGSGDGTTQSAASLLSEAARLIPSQAAGKVEAFTSRLTATTDEAKHAQLEDKKYSRQESPK